MTDFLTKRGTATNIIFYEVVIIILMYYRRFENFSKGCQNCVSIKLKPTLVTVEFGRLENVSQCFANRL